MRLLGVSRDYAAEGVCKEQLRCCDKKRQHPNPLLIHWVCFFVPVKGSACGHAPGKAFDALLSEEGDGGEIGGHDGQWVWRVHKEAVFTEDHVPVLKDTTFSFWIWMGNRSVDTDRINISFHPCSSKSDNKHIITMNTATAERALL